MLVNSVKLECNQSACKAEDSKKDRCCHPNERSAFEMVDCGDFANNTCNLLEVLIHFLSIAFQLREGDRLTKGSGAVCKEPNLPSFKGVARALLLDGADVELGDAEV